jgi:hypothetical protein
MDRSQRVLQAAARDAAARARLLAEALDAVADAAESLAGAPLTSSAPAHPPAVGSGSLWTVADVAQFMCASESWVPNAVAVGRLPCTRIGGLLRFQPDEIRAHTHGDPSPAAMPHAIRRRERSTNPSQAPRPGNDE